MPHLTTRCGQPLLEHRRLECHPTSKEAIMQLLKRKGYWLNDLEDHPVCLGVPLGKDMGLGGAIQVDVGLKSPVTVSFVDLIDASPQLKLALFQRAAQKSSDNVSDNELLRDALPVPVVVLAKKMCNAFQWWHRYLTLLPLPRRPSLHTSLFMILPADCPAQWRSSNFHLSR